MESHDPTNKDHVFDALEAAGIQSVLIEYDGEGDEGFVHEIHFTPEQSDTLILPNFTVTQQVWNGATKAFVPTSNIIPRAARGVLEDFAYDILERHFDEWEHDHGAFGEITLSVAERTVSVVHTSRFVGYDTAEINL